MEEKEIQDKNNEIKKEEKKKIKLKLTTVVIIIIAIIVMITGFTIYKIYNVDKKQENKTINCNKITESNQITNTIGIIEMMPTYKPIIYLYPEKTSEIQVKLLKEESLTCTYPKYRNNWNVIAKPNGDLKEIVTGKNLYALYYENKSNVDFKVEEDGFVVKGEDSASFLEEKLAILGLNDREKEEFIVYWLPKLEANKYNYIRFATMEEINENMPLEVNPKPKSVIRILMTYKGLEKPIKVKEQKLETKNREGYTLVEWGGTLIK